MTLNNYGLIISEVNISETNVLRQALCLQDSPGIMYYPPLCSARLRAGSMNTNGMPATPATALKT